jgi:hypothetical protein
MRPYLKKHFTKIVLVHWLEVKAQSSTPIKAKKACFIEDMYHFIIKILIKNPIFE